MMANSNSIAVSEPTQGEVKAARRRLERDSTRNRLYHGRVAEGRHGIFGKQNTPAVEENVETREDPEESVVGKVLGEVIIEKIRSEVDCRPRKEQTGYRKGRRTTEHVFILRNILQQVNEWQATLYLNFIDFEKALSLIPSTVKDCGPS